MECPEVSEPTIPQSKGLIPNALRFPATFAAPPKCNDSCSKSITGTGASGEILVTLPQKYLSNMMSPTTAIEEPLQDCKISFARSDVIVCMVPSLTVEKTNNVITIQKKSKLQK
jgi:hypothetical protein